MPSNIDAVKTLLQRTLNTLAWLYAITLSLWFGLNVWLGDSVWWLALLSAFAPFFFLPLALLLLTGLFYRRRAFWLSGLAPALIFVLLYGRLFLPRQPPPPTTGQPFIIMTFNVWGYSRSARTARAILADGTPDIVALQELTPAMAQVMVEQLGQTYPYRVLDVDNPNRALGVLSRHSLTELDATHLSSPGAQVQILEIQIGDRKFTLYNCRLPSPNILAYWEQGLSLSGKVGNLLQQRRDATRRLLADINTRAGPIIVAGDFNSTDLNAPYALLTARLSDAHRTAGWGFGHTFPAYAGNYRGIPIPTRQMRLDMIFYSEELIALDSYVSSAHGESDHLPVLARLVLQ
jgi:endonuclease/exonuclease/phosphatase (EEP) superfamily protein YafD